MNHTSAGVYEFQDFQLNVNRRILLKNEKELTVDSRSFDLLVCLIQNRGRLIEKAELLSKVWGEDANVNEEVLTDTISKLRKILGDDRKPYRIIATVSRKGYQFIAEEKLPSEPVPIKKQIEKDEFNPPVSNILFISLLIFLALLGGLIIFRKTDLTIFALYLIFLLICGLFFFQLLTKARNAYKYNHPLPPPEFLWRILFNKLPPSQGSHTRNTPVKVLVIYDSLTTAEYERLNLNFASSNNDNNNLELLSFEYRPENISGSFQKSLPGIQAVYLFLSEEIAEDNNFLSILKSWSEKEIQKPILVVQMNNKPYSLPYDRIAASEGTTSLWRLLSRSIERTSLWYEQATTYRNIWLLTAFSAGFFITAALFFYYQNYILQYNLDNRDKIIENHRQTIARDFQSLRQYISTSIQKPVDPNFKNGFQNNLNEYAQYSYEELISRMTVPPNDGVGHMSFWRLSPDETYFQQIARSQASNEYRTFETSENTIVRCAVENNAFVLWRHDLVSGETAAWSLDGEPIGTWQNGNVNFTSNDPIQSCSRLPIKGDDKTNGLLCLGFISDLQTRKIKSAVCLDVPYRNVQFLNELGTKNYLLQTGSYLHLIPNEILKFKEDYPNSSAPQN